MGLNFLSVRSWIVFLCAEAILAGLLKMLDALSGPMLVLSGVVVLVALLTWEHRSNLSFQFRTKAKQRHNLSIPFALPDQVRDALKGTQSRELNASDLIPIRFALPGKAANGECDISPEIVIKNRSVHTIYIIPLWSIYEIDGEAPLDSRIINLAAALPPTGNELALRFKPIRTYKAHEPIGNTVLVFRFGRKQDAPDNLMILHYSFKITAYPNPRYGQAPVSFEMVYKKEKRYTLTKS